MAISEKVILAKIEKSTKLAEKAGDKQTMKRHLANIQMLCELLLDDGDVTGVRRPEETVDLEVKASDAEIKAMLGAEVASKSKSMRRTTSLEDDAGGGDSIFDF